MFNAKTLGLRLGAMALLALPLSGCNDGEVESEASDASSLGTLDPNGYTEPTMPADDGQTETGASGTDRADAADRLQPQPEDSFSGEPAPGEPSAVAEPDAPSPVAEPEQGNPEAPAPEDEPGEPVVNDAAVVATSFPGGMECGASATASVTLLNQGTTTWTRADGYKLGTVDDEDPLHEAPREWLPEEAVVPPGEQWTFQFQLDAPFAPGVYTTDWQMVQESVEWFGEITAHDVNVTCTNSDEWNGEDLPAATHESVLSSATYVRDSFPQFFDLEELDNLTKRTIAYEMMTTVINHLRTNGTDASRCVANPELSQNDPFFWCSDALVVGPPGLGITIDIYYSWSFPATPQVSITETFQTGIVTADMVPLP